MDINGYPIYRFTNRSKLNRIKMMTNLFNCLKNGRKLGSFNQADFKCKLNGSGRRLYRNRFINLSYFYLIILHLAIKFISTLTFILKYLIIKIAFDEIFNSDILHTYFLVCNITLP